MKKHSLDVVKFVTFFFRVLGTTLFVSLLALVVYIMTCNMQGRVASVFGHSVLKVITGSMEPSIHMGDYISVENVNTDSLHVGDIISFYSTDSEIYGMLNTHRIVKVNADGSFVTRGDANSADDGHVVRSSDIIGKYTGKIRILKWINSFTSKKKLLMLLVILPMLCISFYEVYTIAKIKIDSDEEKERIAAAEKEKLIDEAIQKEKQRLYDEENIKLNSEVTKNESGKNNEKEND